LTKAAVDSLTHGLAIEVGDEGVRVNAVAPGLVDTGLHVAAGLPDRLEWKAPMIPMKRAGQPDESIVASSARRANHLDSLYQKHVKPPREKYYASNFRKIMIC